MLINFTNHPSSSWCSEQISVAERWGNIVDMPFPSVPALADESEISALADACCAKLISLAPDAVLVQGEMTLAFAVAERLRRNGITALCAASERVCETSAAEDGSTIRKSVFRFVRFREYCG
ncbi:MAG: hypothetical protein NC120_03700 [Ruminococcus sp.]|nr:hypothetical protein [Ruminococcus sp.]